MAFGNVYVVLIVLIVGLATISNARVDLRDSSLKPTAVATGTVPGEGDNYCSICLCKKAFGYKICRRYEQSRYCCPLACQNNCVCTKSKPPTCSCYLNVNDCTPNVCPKSPATLHFEDLLLNAKHA